MNGIEKIKKNPKNKQTKKPKKKKRIDKKKNRKEKRKIKPQNKKIYTLPQKFNIEFIAYNLYFLYLVLKMTSYCKKVKRNVRRIERFWRLSYNDVGNIQSVTRHSKSWFAVY